MIMDVIKWVLWAVPFVLLCVSIRKANLDKSERGKQFLMPILALIYCIVTVVYLEKINALAKSVMSWVSMFLPFLRNINLTRYSIDVSNTILLTGFLGFKGVVLPVLKRLWDKSRRLMDVTTGICYEYEEDIDKWMLKKEYGQVKIFYTGIFYAAVVASTLVMIMSKIWPHSSFFKATFYPAFGLIVVGEVINFLSGFTKVEFIEDVLGEDEESYKIVNYGLLRDILRGIFKDRVLYDATTDDGLDNKNNVDMLEEMCDSEDQSEANLGQYFQALKESGENIDYNYVKSCMNLIQGQSTLFCNPFYKDLTHYVMFPMIRQLMRYRKCLVVMGRDSSTDDVQDWLKQGVLDFVHTDSLWKVDLLGTNATETDIGIIKFCDLYNLEIQRSNEEFLRRVGFVFIIEPSRLLATGQVGLSLLVNCFDENNGKIVYSACDRNCDGLVDALSHTLKTNITEVSATSKSSSVTSMMCWEADGPYMHHKILSNISHYLGIGTEINAIAMKHQIENTKWISSDKFPVLDMKWIAGQYYKKICAYTNLPISQEAFNQAFCVESNLWNTTIQKDSFLVVEDEFQNLFELVRVFSTRAQQQGFVNVISERYLLRDYMLDNVQTFISDPKAIPTFVADYARTERNTVLKLIMRMIDHQVSEDEIIQTFMISGIKFDDPFETLKGLIYKHCFINEINMRVFFREKLMEDALRTEVKKYYAIEGDTEIAEYAKNLKNAYYIAEDEKGEKYHIGAKLYGHVFQALVPGQFLTFAGKYYEVQAITPQNGVVVRRAADHITGRKYYRQIRHINISNWTDDEVVGGKKNIADIQIDRGYCQIQVDTDGYWEMSSYEDFKTAKRIKVSGIPRRSYRNKLVMKIKLPEASVRLRYTICLLLNEVFKTTYPDAYPYICAVTDFDETTTVPERLKDIMYTVDCDSDKECIFIVEDSEIDLGLIDSVERNLNRYFEIITEVLMWHEMKMQEKEPESTDGFVPEFEEKPVEEARKKSIFRRILDKVKGFFGKIFSRFKKKSVEEEVVGDGEQSQEVDDAEVKANILQDAIDDQLDIDGEDEEVVSAGKPCGGSGKSTLYKENCFLKLGYSEFEEFLDFEGVVEYLTKYGYNKGPLSQVRDSSQIADEYEQNYDPQKKGSHFCDFCGMELVGGEYEVLKDGRERCNRCSMTALRTGEEFKQVFKNVMRNMEVFYGIKFNVAIKVRMTDAKKIARHVGKKFVATPGFDGRTLGFARKDSTGYSIYVENGSPKLAAMATIAHELTHIWQYQNWNDKEIDAKYGKENSLEVYEGMAKWAEIQYLLYLNEVAYAKRQEIVTRMRDDEYGRGFVKYTKKYPLMYNQEKKRTPFEEIPPL